MIGMGNLALSALAGLLEEETAAWVCQGGIDFLGFYAFWSVFHGFFVLFGGLLMGFCGYFIGFIPKKYRTYLRDDCSS